MDLWIRSQDKKRLIPNPNLYIVFSKESNCAYIGDTLVGHIAKYATETRALDVLDEIQNTVYINKLFNADIGAFKKALENEGYTETEISNALKKISTYEMPKE